MLMFQPFDFDLIHNDDDDYPDGGGDVRDGRRDIRPGGAVQSRHLHLLLLCGQPTGVLCWDMCHSST